MIFLTVLNWLKRWYGNSFWSRRPCIFSKITFITIIVRAIRAIVYDMHIGPMLLMIFSILSTLTFDSQSSLHDLVQTYEIKSFKFFLQMRAQTIIIQVSQIFLGNKNIEASVFGVSKPFKVINNGLIMLLFNRC